MPLPNPKELRALLKVCRDMGVDNLEIGEIKVKFGELPREQAKEEAEQTQALPSDEDMAYWSAQPDPMLALGAKQ